MICKIRKWKLSDASNLAVSLSNKKEQDKGYKQTSLSVQKANYAVNMYQKIGFEVVNENDEEYIMICRL
ncbi:GNAT family N-acetyltransferase [Enterocloster clostridioformis]|nr:GNAT family N-acetyltransferase [Enterocloster clostridioformis]QQQ99222.1 GNAT family N-acetyltransferase [Enterocloster clostridioformis]